MLKKILNNFKRRWLPPVLAYTAKFGLRAILWTCRMEVKNLNHFTHAAETSPCILALWHNCLPLVPEVMSHLAPNFIYRAFISKSRDGEPLARLTLSYKIGRVLRVPHNLRHHALNQMIHHLKKDREILIITPDGPRGPRHKAKPGIIMAAREAEAQIVTFSWEANRCWKLRTWDEMMIPKPFSTIKISFGKPLSFPLNSGKSMEEETQALNEALSKK